MTDTLTQYFKEANEKELLFQANKIAGSIQKANYLFDETKLPFFDIELEEKSKEGSYRILVFDSKGVVVNDSNKTDIGKTYIVPEVVSALEGIDEASLRRDEGSIYASAYIENEYSEKKVGAVLLISSFAEVSQLVAEISQRWFLITIAISAIIAIVVFFVSEIIIGPLRNILKVIEKITTGQLFHRIEIKGSNEFAELGAAFNSMTEKLEQVETTRQEFVSNVSHELKTPLSSIKVLGESILMQENVPIEMYKEFLQDINSEVDRMANIINDLLELVKLEQREGGIHIDETNLNKMVEDIMKRLFPLAEQKNIELLYEENKKVVIDADEMKLSLAISNLVENGIKYTPEGGTVKVIVDSDHQNAFITIQDTGIGINEEEQGKVFDRFYRVDKTRDRETGGSGLGLAITHGAVMLHNGSIKLSSKEDKGTTFVVRLPIKYT